MPQAVIDSHHAVDDLLAAALRGAAAAPPRSQWSELIAAADEHGVLPLLADAALESRWDPELIAMMRPLLAAEAALAILREVELRRVLQSLAASHVEPLLFKGAHLAFTIYDSPDTRPRTDTDLLIAEEDRGAVARCLESLGYDGVPQVTGEVAVAQCAYALTDRSGAKHTIDVHWRIANPKVFADRLTYSDLMRDAVPVPRLGSNAFAPSPPLALLIACLHRTAHHGTSPRLIWLYDIHLLAAQLSRAEWDVVIDVAIARGLARIVAAGLNDSRSALATRVRVDILDRLNAASDRTDADILAFLDGEPPKIRVAVSDWKRIPGWHARAQFLREHLFPPVSFIKHRYGASSGALLPFLYAHRIAAGALKWMRELRA